MSETTALLAIAVNTDKGFSAPLVIAGSLLLGSTIAAVRYRGQEVTG